MEPLAAVALAIELVEKSGAAAELHSHITGKGSLDAYRLENVEDWCSQLAIGLRDLGIERARMLAAFERLKHEHERARVLGNYYLDWVRESLDARRVMLMHGAARTAVDDVHTVADLARVERVLRQLDVEDIETLRNVATTHNTMGAYNATTKGHLEGANLFATGCVIIAAPVVGGGSASITPLGHLVLEVCDAEDGKPKSP